jgi:hypothetical protein
MKFVLDRLNYTTVRLECVYTNGSTGFGTGFFYKFNVQSDGSCCYVIITNKHVIKGSKTAKIHLTHQTQNGEPDNGRYTSITYNDEFSNFEERWVMHPDDSVDLCAMGTTDVHYIFSKKYGHNAMIYALGKENIPSADEISRLSSIEDIIMIGYPNALWDEKSNRPIFRRGITATHPSFDFNGKKEFLVDIACFPGSSGSPVLAAYEGKHYDKSTSSEVEERKLFLLGVNYSVYIQEQAWNIKKINIPTNAMFMNKTTIPINLASVIKAERILELENRFIYGDTSR